MPKSRIRKKADFTPPPGEAGDRHRLSNRSWVAPVMLALFLIGLAWIVVFYVTEGDMPIEGARATGTSWSVSASSPVASASPPSGSSGVRAASAGTAGLIPRPEATSAPVIHRDIHSGGKVGRSVDNFWDVAAGVTGSTASACPLCHLPRLEITRSEQGRKRSPPRAQVRARAVDNSGESSHPLCAGRAQQCGSATTTTHDQHHRAGPPLHQRARSRGACTMPKPITTPATRPPRAPASRSRQVEAEDQVHHDQHDRPHVVLHAAASAPPWRRTGRRSPRTRPARARSGAQQIRQRAAARPDTRYSAR